MLRRVIILFVLALSLNLASITPAIAQTTLKQNQNLEVYVPKQIGVKDEQNIALLSDLIKTETSFADVFRYYESDKEKFSLPKFNPPKNNRNELIKYYYSPDEGFAVRESIKLVRAMSCKVSRISGVRGVNLVSKVLSYQEQDKPSDKKSTVLFWKAVYEHFCPDLW